METNIVSTRRATGMQLQAAAKAAKLDSSTNQVFGLYQAMFCSEPSPMQIKILQKGLSATGVNHLKITEKVEPATEVDRAPFELQVGIKTLANMVCHELFGQPSYTVRAAGTVLYVHLTNEEWTASAKLAKAIAARYKFYRNIPSFKPKVADYKKVVRVGRQSLCASIEINDDKITLSVWRTHG